MTIPEIQARYKVGGLMAISIKNRAEKYGIPIHEAVDQIAKKLQTEKKNP